MGSEYFRVVLTDPEPTQIFTSKGELLHQMGRGSRENNNRGSTTLLLEEYYMHVQITKDRRLWQHDTIWELTCAQIQLAAKNTNEDYFGRAFASEFSCENNQQNHAF